MIVRLRRHAAGLSVAVEGRREIALVIEVVEVAIRVRLGCEITPGDVEATAQAQLLSPM